MLLPASSLFASFVRGLLLSLLVLSTVIPVTAQQKPAALLAPSPLPAPQAWVNFQLDACLRLQLPAPPKQMQTSGVPDQQTQAYMAHDSLAIYVLMRFALPTGAPAPAPDVLYTGTTQTLLTSMKAVRVNQVPFHVGQHEGLRVDYRIPQPAPGHPATGTLWAVQLGLTVYVAQWMPLASSSPAQVTAQHTRFLRSWVVNPSPSPPPTPADFARFKSGTFRYLDPAQANVSVVRTDTAQIEEAPHLGLRIVYGLRWTQEGYILHQRSSTSPGGPLPPAKPLVVQITAVTGDTYAYRAIVEGFILTGQIQRVK